MTSPTWQNHSYWHLQSNKIKLRQKQPLEVIKNNTLVVTKPLHICNMIKTANLGPLYIPGVTAQLVKRIVIRDQFGNGFTFILILLTLLHM